MASLLVMMQLPVPIPSRVTHRNSKHAAQQMRLHYVTPRSVTCSRQQEVGTLLGANVRLIGGGALNKLITDYSEWTAWHYVVLPNISAVFIADFVGAVWLEPLTLFESSMLLDHRTAVPSLLSQQWGCSCSWFFGKGGTVNTFWRCHQQQ
jgi:hypothetical protein